MFVTTILIIVAVLVFLTMLCIVIANNYPYDSFMSIPIIGCFMAILFCGLWTLSSYCCLEPNKVIVVDTYNKTENGMTATYYKNFFEKEYSITNKTGYVFDTPQKVEVTQYTNDKFFIHWDFHTSKLLNQTRITTSDIYLRN